ncbi:MAG: hypothetical protein HZA34_02375 [Candidatus Pacebacteria bacterium]|nr:hypothetical protein [Candidatus Paceibacterota bacterium]
MNDSENQTQFIEEQPMLQQEKSVTAIPTPPIDSLIPEKKQFPIKKVFVFGGGVCLLLFILVLMVMGKGKNSLKITEPSPSPKTTQQLSDFQKSLQLFHTDVERADPTVNDLPYPPVNTNLYIIQR